MAITKKLKLNWENDLWQAIGEQDVLKLKNQLKLIRNPKNENLRNYAMNEMNEKK